MSVDIRHNLKSQSHLNSFEIDCDLPSALDLTKIIFR